MVGHLENDDQAPCSSTEGWTPRTECDSRICCCSKEKCLKTIHRRIPITKWLPNYKWGYVPHDILAGITVGLTAIPQGIAYAVVAGLEPQYGLYSGIMGCLAYLLLGSCKDVNIGPTAIMALMIQPHVDKMGPDMAVLASFLTGCVILFLGLLQLGFLVDFISFPVVSGFTSAAALTIASSQIKNFFGLPGKSNDFIESWKTLFEHIGDARLADTLLAVGSIIFLLVARKLKDYGQRTYNPDWSGSRNVISRICWMVSLSRNAIIVIFGTFLAWCFSLYGTQPFKITGKVGGGFPTFHLPPFETTFKNHTYDFVDMSRQLSTTIIFMPLCAVLESIAITKAFSKGKSVDATQELIALGSCNLFGSFIRSMSVTGSFTRTALNNASGVKTTLGGVFTAITVILALELLTTTFYFIPKATLASVILCAMLFMLEIDVAILLWRTKRWEVIHFGTTLVSGLLLGVEYGILFGIGCNLLSLLYSTARPSVDVERCHVAFRHVVVVRPGQSLYFPAADYVRDKVIKVCEDYDVVIDGQYVHAIDSTVAKNLSMLIEDMRVRDQTVVLWNFCDGVKQCCIKLNPKMEEHFYQGDLQHAIRKSSSAILEVQR